MTGPAEVWCTKCDQPSIKEVQMPDGSTEGRCGKHLPQPDINQVLAAAEAARGARRAVAPYTVSVIREDEVDVTIFQVTTMALAEELVKTLHELSPVDLLTDIQGGPSTFVVVDQADILVAVSTYVLDGE